MKHWLLVVALSATVMLTGLGASRLWDDDEPRNAGCAREMLARWDWIVPTFNAQLRAHKPALTYWCMMVAYMLLGESEFSARLPSALAAIGTTLLTYAMGRRLFSRQAALWAALVLPTTMLFVMAGRIATPDSLLIFCVTLAMAVYVGTAWPSYGESGSYDKYENHKTTAPAAAPFLPRCWWQAAAVYAAMGLAVLAKGPVGLVLPTAILGMFLLIMRWQPTPGTGGSSWWASASVNEPGRPSKPAALHQLLARPVAHLLTTAWSMRPLTALAAAALVAGPWYVAVGYLTDWEFLREFFLTHNLRRATGAMEGHSAGIWFYPVMVLIGFFPWSIFAIPLAIETWRGLRPPGPQRAALLLLVCWMVVWLGAFTLARTKLPSYATPCFPAAALLTGWLLERLVRGKATIARFWPAASFACLVLVGAAAPIGLWIAANRYLPGDEWLATVGLIPGAGGAMALWVWFRGQPAAAAGTVVATGGALALGVFGLGAVVADRHQDAGKLLAAAERTSKEPRVASFHVLEPSWVYYARRPIREIRGSPAQALEFLAASENSYLITTSARWERLSNWPDSAEFSVLAEAEWFLKNERLVIVGRRAEGVARARKPSKHR
jgi:4-amino-4-deoxy-L-arabinose transferase-like glycosyltransferase